jgi:CheY-like chemotaxis protein
MTHLRILLAEDNRLNAKIVVRIRTQAGHVVDVAKDGAEAVDAVSTAPYDLVLMDIQIPVMDGVEATRKIRALQGAVAKIPIITLTAHAMEGDREKYLMAGMDDYVSKPVNPDALAAAIERQTGVKTSLEPFLRTKPAETEILGAARDSVAALLNDIDKIPTV